MKKSLLALAVLGAFAGAASAQSSVTVYGVVDLGVAKGNGGTSQNNGSPGSLNATFNPGAKAYQVRQSRGSRLGFRGNEDLGGGLSAQFLIEHRFTPDNGAAAATFWDGGSYVQLTHAAAGSVYLGRWYTPIFWVNLKTDPFGYDGVGQAGVKGLAGYYTGGQVTGGSGVRTSNTVGYKTPTWGGFTVNLATGLGEGAAGVGRTDGINAEFTSGPIYVGAGYEKVNGGAPSANVTAPTGAIVNGDGASVFNVGAAYNFGFIRPIAYFAQSKNGLGNSKTNTYWHLGLTAPVGPGVIKALYSQLDPEVTSGVLLSASATVPPFSGAQTANLKQTKIAVGYDYFLSKRTRVYADYSTGKEDTKTNNNAYNIGIRHDF
jgi:predicted porin